MPPRLQIGTQPASPKQLRETLWSTAPGWRKLVIGSGVLTLLAVSAPILLPRPETAPGTQSAHAVGPARPLSDPDTRKGSVMIRIDLLEHVDGAGPGRIDTLAGGVEPQVIDAEYAGKACNDRT